MGVPFLFCHGLAADAREATMAAFLVFRSDSDSVLGEWGTEAQRLGYIGSPFNQAIRGRGDLRDRAPLGVPETTLAGLLFGGNLAPFYPLKGEF
jgi:hypothetical protein